MAPLFQLGPRRLTLHQQPGVGRQRQRHQIRVSAALTAADLRQRALKLDTYDDDAVAQACTKLTAALGPDKAAKCGKETLEWFLRDRKLDVEKSAAKVDAYLLWRAGGFDNVTRDSVAHEAATGKARLLAQRDMLGRPVVLVKVALQFTDTRVLADTERLCVHLMDLALQQMHAEGRAQTVLTIFDLRGFTTKNADVPFIRFFIKLMFDIYPKRIGQVLLVGAPLVFQPLWAIVKPLLGKYAALVQFVNIDQAREYFADSVDELQ